MGTFPIATWASKRVATWARKRVASMKKQKKLLLVKFPNWEEENFLLCTFGGTYKTSNWEHEKLMCLLLLQKNFIQLC